MVHLAEIQRHGMNEKARSRLWAGKPMAQAFIDRQDGFLTSQWLADDV